MLKYYIKLGRLQFLLYALILGIVALQIRCKLGLEFNGNQEGRKPNFRDKIRRLDRRRCKRIGRLYDERSIRFSGTFFFYYLNAFIVEQATLVFSTTCPLFKKSY